jgi:serine/threonine-protein kinase
LIGALLGALLAAPVALFLLFWGFLEDAMTASEDTDEKIRKCRDAVRQRPDDPRAHYDLGRTLDSAGREDEARDAYQMAVGLRTDDPKLCLDLGSALNRLGRPDEAIQAYHEAVRLNKELPDAHFKLGLALYAQGRLDEAIATFREVLRLENNAFAQYHLGLALRDQGQLDQAVVAFRHSRDERSVAALRETERIARVAGRLPAVLEGKDRPGDANECLLFAQLCQLPYQKRYAAAARFFEEAFARQPDLAEDRDHKHRYQAAAAAVRAGGGQCADAASLDESERARLRRQALKWLSADLAAWRDVMETERDKFWAAARISLAVEPWLKDPDFAGVREPQALAPLPEAERRGWQELWHHVAATREWADRQAAASRR